MQDLSQFIVHLQEKSLSKNTINIIIRNITQYLNYNKDIYSYREYIKNKYSYSTTNMKIYSVNKYLAFLNLNDRLKYIPIPKNKTLENVISLEEYGTLLNFLKEHNYEKEYFAIRVLGCTGMRPSELFKLQSKDIIQGYAKICSKREKTRNIYFPPLLKADLLKYIKDYNIEGQIFDISLDHIRYTMRLGVKVGIRREVLYPYTLRHMFGKAFIHKNPNLSMLSDILGHENIETTRIYTRLTREEQHQAIMNIVDWDF